MHSREHKHSIGQMGIKQNGHFLVFYLKFYPFLKQQPWKFSTKLICNQLEISLRKKFLAPSDKVEALLHQQHFFFLCCVLSPP